MDSKFIPNSESLSKTDFRKPQFDKTDKKNVLLMAVCIVMLAVVFLPWFCIGLEVEDIGSFKLRSFGFDSWYGIVGGVLALVSVAGVLYKHYAVTLWSSVAAILISFIALNVYPTSRVTIDFDKKAERQLKEIVKDYERGDYYEYQREEAIYAQAIKSIMDLPSIKVPGPIVAGCALLVECVDQKAVYEFLEENVDDDITDRLDIINHRWGNIVFMIMAALGALLSYLVIAKPRMK